MNMKTLLFCAVLFCSSSLFQTRGASISVEPTVEKLNKINVTELLSGPKISDELKARLINCLNDSGPNPANCPSANIPISDPVQRILSLSNVAPSTPVTTSTGLLSTLDNVMKTIISNPLAKAKESLQTAVEQAPTIVTELKAALSGAKQEAETLISLAGQITTVTKKPDPLDPYQDISQYLKTKNPSNVKYDAEGLVKNRRKLTDTFANADTASLRRYAANYNPLVPDVLIIGTLRGYAHL